MAHSIRFWWKAGEIQTIFPSSCRAGGPGGFPKIQFLIELLFFLPRWARCSPLHKGTFPFPAFSNFFFLSFSLCSRWVHPRVCLFFSEAAPDTQHRGFFLVLRAAITTPAPRAETKPGFIWERDMIIREKSETTSETGRNWWTSMKNQWGAGMIFFFFFFPRGGRKLISKSTSSELTPVCRNFDIHYLLLTFSRAAEKAALEHSRMAQHPHRIFISHKKTRGEKSKLIFFFS